MQNGKSSPEPLASLKKQQQTLKAKAENRTIAKMYQNNGSRARPTRKRA